MPAFVISALGSGPSAEVPGPMDEHCPPPGHVMVEAHGALGTVGWAARTGIALPGATIV